MRNYNDSSARDAAARLLSLVNRVTILREKEPSDALKLLAGAAECIINGDCMGAYIKHCALCRALIKSPARRVSGSIFADYLIHLAVGYEHSFALSSATGMLDEAQLMLFRSDLSALGELSTLDSADISRMAIQRSRELNSRSRYARDDISVMSTAAWGGTEPKPMPHNKEAMPAEAALQPPAEGEWPAWSYGEKGMRGEYAADEVLEEIYISLTESDNWKSAAQDLFNAVPHAAVAHDEKFQKDALFSLFQIGQQLRIHGFAAGKILRASVLPRRIGAVLCHISALPLLAGIQTFQHTRLLYKVFFVGILHRLHFQAQTLGRAFVAKGQIQRTAQQRQNTDQRDPAHLVGAVLILAHKVQDDEQAQCVEQAVHPHAARAGGDGKRHPAQPQQLQCHQHNRDGDAVQNAAEKAHDR